MNIVVKINVNDIIKVKLTEKGERILERMGLEYLHEPDEDGWSSWQIWVLMETFGNHVGMSSQVPFETGMIYGAYNVTFKERY